MKPVDHSDSPEVGAYRKHDKPQPSAYDKPSRSRKSRAKHQAILQEATGVGEVVAPSGTGVHQFGNRPLTDNDSLLGYLPRNFRPEMRYLQQQTRFSAATSFELTVWGTSTDEVRLGKSRR